MADGKEQGPRVADLAGVCCATGKSSLCSLPRGLEGDAPGAAMGVQVLFDPDAPYEARLPSWAEVTAALSVVAVREVKR